MVLCILSASIKSDTLPNFIKVRECCSCGVFDFAFRTKNLLNSVFRNHPSTTEIFTTSTRSLLHRASSNGLIQVGKSLKPKSLKEMATSVHCAVASLVPIICLQTRGSRVSLRLVATKRNAAVVVLTIVTNEETRKIHRFIRKCDEISKVRKELRLFGWN